MNVFIVENSLPTRVGLQSVLSDMPSVRVMGRAVSESGAIASISALLPEIVILDIKLQSGSGIGVLENIKRCHPAIKFVVFTHYAGEDCVERCMRAGADYFFDKSSQLMQLREILWKWAHTDRLDNNMRFNRRISPPSEEIVLRGN